MTLLMGVNNCGIGGTNQGYGYLQGAYWGGGTNPIILNPKGGNVGINSAQARVALDVNGDQLLKLSGTNQLLRKIGFTGNGIYASHPTYMGGYADNGPWSSGIALVFGTIRSGDVSSSTGIERMRISSDGNVGIGTTSPSHRLDVSGSGNFTDGLTVTGSILHDGDLTVTGTLTAQEFKTELVSASIVYQSGSTKFGDTSDDVHSFSGSLRVTGSGDHYIIGGDVGIGTTNPTGKFNSYIDANNQLIHQSVSQQNLVITGTNASVVVDSTNSSYPSFFVKTQGVANGQLTNLNGQSSSGISLLNASGVGLSITSTGNVGIGTTSPSYKLDVSGSGNFTDGLTVTGSLTTTGDLTVEGTITAREFKTELVSASILYQSGSTKFGIHRMMFIRSPAVYQLVVVL